MAGTTDQGLAKTIRKGLFFGMAMPAYKNDLSEEEALILVRDILRKVRRGTPIHGPEATTAARAGALKRLQAAIELAQRTAVKVQTVYFQKQIGSLSRQLDAALGKKKPPLKASATAAAAPAPDPRARAR